jgi:hypothetical protein
MYLQNEIEAISREWSVETLSIIYAPFIGYVTLQPSPFLGPSIGKEHLTDY